MKKILLTGGGTAGHIIPNIALIPYLKNDFDKIYYIGEKNGLEEKIIKEHKEIEFYPITCAKLIRSFTVKNLSMPFKVIKGVTNAGKILDKIKPDIVFSKGGYVALPVIIASYKRKIPIVIHESDFTMGLSNKISSKFANKVLTSFYETAQTTNKGFYVGSPIRNELFSISQEKALKNFGFNGEKPVLLITGGSLGAKTINDTFTNIVDDLLKNFDIIHICGKNYKNKLNKKGLYQTEYLDNMELALNACDIALSRAGSNTVFELLSLEKPTLLIPLPKGISRGDQVLNAEYFLKKGMVSVIKQELLTEKYLLFSLNSLYASRKIIKENIKNCPVKNASAEISRIIADTVK